MKIISRSKWGARAWNGQPYSVSMRERDWFLVHYHGGVPAASRGVYVPRNVENIHLGNGWSGVGYNFIVDQDGRIYEGRGWNLVGAHCPGHNRNGLGVYVAVGGNQKPTKEALAAVKWLYEEGSRKRGKDLIKSYHGFDYPTACPGDHLRSWVQGGMIVASFAGAVSAINEIKNKVTKPTKKKDGERVTVDGHLGPETYRAIQEWAGATQDGLWGPETRRALQRKLGVTADGIIGRGTVRALQRKVGVNVDGIWGPATTKGLQKFLNKTLGGTAGAVKAEDRKKPKPVSKSNDITVDGKLGTNTYKAIQKWVGVKQDGIWGPNTIRGLQRKIGVNDDGLVGPRTVRALQERVGVKVDGIWGDDTTRALQRYLNKHVL